jgi:hypothetical protein
MTVCDIVNKFYKANEKSKSILLNVIQFQSTNNVHD